MKKIGKLLITCTLVCGFLFAVTGCTGNNAPFVPPEPDGSKVSINDAYDWNDDKTGSNRPDLGGDYEPTLPPTESKVTIAEGSTIRFAGGKTELTLPIGNILKAEDFDPATLGGRQIGGVGVVGEDSKINGYTTLVDFAPMGDVSVMPYFAPENGEPFIFGSSRVGDYFHDVDGNNVDSELITEYALVGGYMGRSVSCADELKKDTYFRSVTVCEREEGQSYTYYFRFANFGQTDLSFTVYQMYGGYDWANDGTASSPITLAPGAVSDLISVNVTKNKDDANTLTLIKLDADVTGMSLGVSMEVENSTVTAPAKITLDLPSGFTVADGYVTDVKTNDKLVLPTSEQITNETGHNLLYWAYADGTRVVEGARITGDITLKPVLTEDATITFDLPDGFTVSDDYARTLQTGDTLALPTAAQITNTTGRDLIRWVDGSGNVVVSGVKITGNITLVPELSSPVTVTVQLPAGMTVSGYAPQAMTGDVIVPPTDEQIAGTPADGRRIEGWYVVGDNSIITDESIYTDTNTTIAPYFTRRAGTATMCNFDDAEIDGKPLVFNNNQSDSLPLGFYPAEGSTLSLSSFAPTTSRYTNDTAVGGGEDGYAELGNVLSYNGKMIAGDAFRCASIVTNNDKNIAVVKTGVEHTFYYNFENLGDSAVHFTVQGVNNGKEVEGPVKNIDLLPGESTVVTFSVTYTKGSDNRNIIAFFTVKEDIDDLKLGVSVNVVLGRETVSVSLKNDIEGFALADSYLNAVRHAGDTLTLPTSSDYTDTNAKRRVVGWKDGEGNILHDGIELTGNIVLDPVFEISAVVSFELPAGITFTDGFEAEKIYVVGDTLVLPTDAQINNTLNNILYWYIKDTNTRVDDSTEITGDMVIVPYIEPDQREPVTITAGSVDGFTLSEDYLAATQYKGDLLILPSADQFTYDTNKKFEGWMDQSGNTLTANTIIGGDIVLVPKLTAYADFKIELPDGLTLDSGYNTKYLAGEKLVLPTAEEITATPAGYGEPLGWFDVKTGLAVTNDTVITEGLTIAPYFEHNADYNYVKVGSGSAIGYNTDEVPGDILAHLADGSAAYNGNTNANAENAAIIYGGKDGYSVYGSILSDTAPVTAGSAIRFDSAHPQTISGNTVVEYKYTVWNKGATDLKLSIYQISGSSEYKKAGSYYAYESRYRVEINLAPGESTTAIAQYLLGANGNALTYVVFEKDVASFSFGLAINSKIVENATDVAVAYKNQPALTNPVTLTYDPANNHGVTVNADYLNKRAGKFIVAPTADQFNAPADITVAKWQLVIGDDAYDLPASMTDAGFDYMSVRIPSSGATLKAVKAKDLTVTWSAVNGVTAEGAKTSYKTGEKLSIPALATSTTDGRTHDGWFDTVTKNIVTADTVVTENMTLAPYFAPAVPATALTLASGQQGSDKGLDKFTIGTLTDGEARNNFTKVTDVVVGNEKGIILRYSGELADGNTFRAKTSCSLSAGQTYRFTIKFVNYGSEELKFTVYQIKSYAEYEGMPNKAITLAPNATDTAVLQLETGANGNALTYFIMNAAASGFNLGVAMSVETVTA